MNRHVVLTCLTAALAASAAPAADWPTHRHDNLRSGVTDEPLNAAGLGLAWSWQSPYPPARAWDGAATHDAYHGLRGFADARDYDHAFHPVAAGGRVYFGSSVDDSLRCLDAATGRPIWRFTAEAPIRVAPTVADARVYFGGDDGVAYCLGAADGSLVWKYTPTPPERRILNNGRPIALRPCRTGVVVAGGTAYLAFSMLPWERTYLCALDAATGKPEGPGRFARVCQPFSLEGPVALKADRLYMPQGRSAAMTFDLSSGRDTGPAGSAGSLVAFSADGSRFYSGPSNRAPSTGGYGGARDMVASGAVDYVASARGLAAMSRQAGKPAALWNQPMDAWAVALAGNTVVAGGRDRLALFSTADGRELASFPVAGAVRGLAVAEGRVMAATDEGGLYCFAPGGRLVPPPPAPKGQPIGSPDAAPIRLPVGPYAQFTAPDKAVIRWETPTPGPSVLEVAAGSDGRRISDPTPKTQHALTVDGLKRYTEYRYLVRVGVDGQERTTAAFPLDTFFNYTIAPMPESATLAGAGATAQADRILEAAGIRDGIAVVLGGGREPLAYELARRSRLRVLIYDAAPAAVAAAREALMPTGQYGARVSAHLAESMDLVPLVSESADLVVCAGPATAEAMRLARPGGAVVAGEAVTRKPAAAGAGVWSHQYGRADNATYGGEALAGAQTSRELGVQWIGRPGPRYQADREPRKPAPLAVNGRLFGQGLRRIVATDAHNGTILWSLEIPDFLRFNMPDDCSNWCADDDHVYAVVKDRCWQIEAATGRLVRTIPVTEGEWGYVGRQASSAGPRLIGTSGGGHALNFAGPGGWYDDAGTGKNTSQELFAVDPGTGKRLWAYRKGAIINSTITLAAGRAFFIDAREGLWAGQVLVALDLADGKVVYETPFACPGKSMVYHLAWGSDRLVLMSNTGYTYHVYAFDATDAGKARQLWLQKFDGRGHHGGHMGRQGIVGDKVFARPKILDLATGNVLGDMPTGGCGTYSLSRHAVFFRADHTTMWSFTSREGSNFTRLRPDCWLSTVPACGLLLSPEASGGCWCGNWLETSIAFAPRTDVPVFDTADLEFTGSLDVKLRAPLGGGAIHYTVDGSAPSAASPKLAGPIRLSDTATVRACVVTGGRAGPEVARHFGKVQSQLPDALTVTFGPPGKAPAGCVADHGEVYGVRPCGFAYGWSEPMKNAVRARGRASDPRQANTIYFMPGVTWSVAVANGDYEVTVSCGDGAYKVNDATVFVNGVTVCKGLSIDQGDFKTTTAVVTVTDGRLKMSSHDKAAPSERTRINFIQFRKK